MSEVPATNEDPKSTASYRLARAAVIILGVLLVIALIMVVVGIAMKLSGRGPVAEAEQPAHFTLAPGARIVSMDAQPGRLILRIRTEAGEEIDIIDTESGRLVGQVKTAPEPAK